MIILELGSYRFTNILYCRNRFTFNFLNAFFNSLRLLFQTSKTSHPTTKTMRAVVAFFFLAIIFAALIDFGTADQPGSKILSKNYIQIQSPLLLKISTS